MKTKKSALKIIISLIICIIWIVFNNFASIKFADYESVTGTVEHIDRGENLNEITVSYKIGSHLLIEKATLGKNKRVIVGDNVIVDYLRADPKVIRIDIVKDHFPSFFTIISAMGIMLSYPLSCGLVNYYYNTKFNVNLNRRG